MASKWMETMVKKHGSVEAVKAYMAELAKKNKGIKKRSGVATLSKAEQSKRGKKAADARWGNRA